MKPFHLRTAALLVSLIVFFAGCRSLSPPLRYYTLNAIPDASDVAAPVEAAAGAVTIGLMPLRLPGYINRTQMVMRDGNNRITFSVLDRWADYPDRLISQILGENLQALLPRARVVTAPWPVGVTPDLRLTVQIFELIGTDDRQVIFNADWTVARGSSPGDATFYRAAFAEPLSGSGFDGLAAAYSRVLERFCRDVVAALSTTSLLHGR